jgi:penicillin-binding protein 1A
VGGTGKYVSSVWFGNDDNRPMANGATGGGVAAQAYQRLMSTAHGTTGIPTIPGLPVHPVQAAERAQMAAAYTQRNAAPASSAGGPRRQQSIMPAVSMLTRPPSPAIKEHSPRHSSPTGAQRPRSPRHRSMHVRGNDMALTWQ